jgi:hypothetical protein
LLIWFIINQSIKYKMDTPLNIVSRSPNWMLFRFSYPVNDFTSNFKTTSEFINKLLNGNEIFEENSNKSFFKEDVLGGIYFNYTTEDIRIIKFIFCFEYQSDENEEQITYSIKKRIKTLLNARIESVPTYSMDKKMKAILNLSVNNLFLRFGNQKVNKTKR